MAFRPTQKERATIGLRVAAARALSGLSLRDVADDVGVSIHAVYQWEHGAVPRSAEHRAGVARLYGIDESHLFPEYEAWMADNREQIA